MKGTYTNLCFKKDAQGAFYLPGTNAVEPDEAAKLRQEQLVQEWLAACEKNQGYAPGTHPARAAIARNNSKR